MQSTYSIKELVNKKAEYQTKKKKERMKNERSKISFNIERKKKRKK